MDTATVPSVPLHQQAQVARAVEVLDGGGLVLLPTETVYGIVGRLDRPEAVARLRQFRGRDAQSHPLTLHVAAPADSEPFLGELSLYQRWFVARLWPGPVAMVFSVHASGRQEVLARLTLAEADLYDGSRITVRCPDHDVAREVLCHCGGPVGGLAAAGTGGPVVQIGDLTDQAAKSIDFLLDVGKTRFGGSSTVVQVDEARYTLIRPGVIEQRILERRLKTTILFVCSGNTCRSPMAAALARHVLAEKLHVSEAQLEASGFAVSSAGTSAMPGAAATENAVIAVRELGGDLSRHRSRPLTDELIRQADLIFAMGRNHAAQIRAMSGSAAGKTWMLDPSGDISDPIGGDLRLYQELAGRLKSLIETRLSDGRLIQQQVESGT